MIVQPKYLDKETGKWEALPFKSPQDPMLFAKIADSFDRIILALKDDSGKIRLILANNEIDIDAYKDKVSTFSIQEWVKVFGTKMPVDIEATFPGAGVEEVRSL